MRPALDSMTQYLESGTQRLLLGDIIALWGAVFWIVLRRNSWDRWIVDRASQRAYRRPLSYSLIAMLAYGLLFAFNNKQVEHVETSLSQDCATCCIDGCGPGIEEIWSCSLDVERRIIGDITHEIDFGHEPLNHAAASWADQAYRLLYAQEDERKQYNAVRNILVPEYIASRNQDPTGAAGKLCPNVSDSLAQLAHSQRVCEEGQEDHRLSIDAMQEKLGGYMEEVRAARVARRSWSWVRLMGMTRAANDGYKSWTDGDFDAVLKRHQFVEQSLRALQQPMMALGPCISISVTAMSEDWSNYSPCKKGNTNGDGRTTLGQLQEARDGWPEFCVGTAYRTKPEKSNTGSGGVE